MASAWLRNPLAPFIAGIVVVVLSTLALTVVERDTGRSELEVETQPSDESGLATTAFVSPGRGALHGQAVLALELRGSKYVDWVGVVIGPLGGRHTLLWLEEYEAKTQTLVRPAEVPRGSLHDPNSVVYYAVQRRTAGGERELGVVYDAASFGSGRPVARFALLRLEEGEWRVLWDSGSVDEWRGSHGTVEFPNGDLSELVVRSDSWSDGHDELSNVLHESNVGPHRHFVDRWIRDGNAYVRSSAETVSAPYATLVAFLYALSTADDTAALARVEHSELVASAREFGLDQAPGKGWLVNSHRGLEIGKNEPITFDPDRYQGEPPVAVYFEEIDGEWLISDIQLDDGS